ncbi:hypothetical protein [Actinoplanes sp. CA-252034]|uniref:hypothetical protein n=1 Tax=Actinoplanes sp. CA-252034 TaxID=3239906 RepID=UPI003D96B390
MGGFEVEDFGGVPAGVGGEVAAWFEDELEVVGDGDARQWGEVDGVLGEVVDAEAAAGVDDA